MLGRRIKIIVFCVCFALLFLIRDLWISPNPTLLPRDIAIAACIAVAAGLYHWLCGNWKHYDDANSIVGVVGYAWLGVWAFAIGSRVIAIVLAVLSGWEAFEMISRIAQRKSGSADLNGKK